MVAAAADATTPTSKPDAAAVAGERGAGFAAATAGYPSSAGEEDEVAAAAAPVVASSTTLRQPRPNTPQHRYLRETPGVAAGGGGAPGKEDGSVWSDKDTISSVAPSPLGRGHALHGDHHAHGSDGLEGTTTPSRLLRSPSLESSLIGGTAGVVVGDGGGEGDEGEEEEREKQERRTRAASITASNVSMHTNASLSPATTPLGGQQQRRRQQQDQPEGVYDGGGGPGHGAGSSAAGFSLAAPSPPGAASSSTAGAGSGSAADGRERRGFSSLLGMGGNKERERRGRGSNHDGADDGGEVEVLRAEAEELRAEVEELSLELEDAEDRQACFECGSPLALPRTSRGKFSAFFLFELEFSRNFPSVHVFSPNRQEVSHTLLLPARLCHGSECWLELTIGVIEVSLLPRMVAGFHRMPLRLPAFRALCNSRRSFAVSYW